MTSPKLLPASETQVDDLFGEVAQFSLQHNDLATRQGADPFGLRHVRVEPWEMPETTLSLLPEQEYYMLQPKTDNEAAVGVRFTALGAGMAHHVSYSFPDTADALKLERRLTTKPYLKEEIPVEAPEPLRALGALTVSSTEAAELISFMQELQNRTA
jgi:hypothetical protein